MLSWKSESESLGTGGVMCMERAARTATVGIGVCLEVLGLEREPEMSRKWGLCDLGDDSLSTVLSFLSPRDILTCARVCRQLRAFCSDDRKVWLPMCERRWGEQTCVQKWGRRKVSFRVLHCALSKLENLVGFWRGVGHGGHGSLVVFEWGLYFVRGFRVAPSRLSSYDVRKVPFVWIGVSDRGRTVCFFDPGMTGVPFLCENSGDHHTSSSSPSCSRRSSSGLKATSRNPFSELGPESDLEQQSPPLGLVVVDLHFVGKFHIVMEEQQQQPLSPGSGSPGFDLKMVASLGASGNLAAEAAAASAGVGIGGARASSPEPDRFRHSPPGSFQYEMYQFLASKVTSQGGDRATRKQRRREKERAFIQGRRTCEPEHFVKVRDVSPTPARPLQGLWKGICDSMGLDFLLLLYDDQGGIVCRRVGECLGTTHSGSVCWTAKASSTITAPLPDFEQSMFVSQRMAHTFSADIIRPDEITDFSQDVFDEEVVGMLCTNPIMGLDFGGMSRVENIEGRVWQYASGRFGFGFLPKNYIIDFRPICSSQGLLLDVLD